MTLQKILVPTDGSETAERALSYALAVASRTDAQIHIVNVEEREPELSEVIAIRESDIVDTLHADLSDRDGESVMPDEDTEPTIQRTVICPSAANGIVTYADEHDIDLIVMGTHGRSGLTRAVMGSVAEEVVREASCPVLTACPRVSEVDIGAGEEPNPDPILVAVDLSPASDEVIGAAAQVASLFGASMKLLHVVERVSLPPAYGVGASSLNNEAVLARARQALQKKADTLADRGISASVHVETGHAATTLLDAVEDEDPGLAVVGTHGFQGVKRVILGSVAEQVIRRAACPVLTVRTPHGSADDESPRREAASADIGT